MSYITNKLEGNNPATASSVVSTGNVSGTYGSFTSLGVTGNAYVHSITLDAGNASQYPIKLQPATASLSPSQAGVINYDGTVFYATPMDSQRGIWPTLQYYSLESDRTTTLGNGNPASVLGVGAALTANTRYNFQIDVIVNHSTGNRTPTISWDGGSTLSKIIYQSITMANALGVAGTAHYTLYNTLTSGFTTGVNLTSSAINAGDDIGISLWGTVDVGSTGGTFTPLLGWSADPGTVIVRAQSSMSIFPVSVSGSNTNVGNWS